MEKKSGAGAGAGAVKKFAGSPALFTPVDILASLFRSRRTGRAPPRGCWRAAQRSPRHP